MNDFSARFAAFNARSPRERVLIGLTACAALWSLWLVSVADPNHAAKVRVAANVNQLVAELSRTEAEQVAFEARQRDASVEIMRLKKRYSELSRREMDNSAVIAAKIAHLVAPEELPSLLRSVMDKHPRVQLITLELVEADQSQEALKGAFTRHPLVLEVRGEYLPMLEYVQALESLPYAIGWRRLDYQVVDYPIGELRLELETLVPAQHGPSDLSLTDGGAEGLAGREGSRA